MSDLFAEQVQALRASSLDRHLSEIGSAQGPNVGSARLRITVTSSHEDSQIEALCDALRHRSAR